MMDRMLAERAVEYLAEQHIKSKKVVSIGVKKRNDAYIVRMTISSPLKVTLPLLPQGLEQVPVEIVMGSPAHRQ